MSDMWYSGVMKMGSSAQRRTETVVFGGGCFWCTEAVFSELRGVLSVEPGYAGGTTPNPTYLQVCMGMTGHAEVVRVTYDPSIITFRDLLSVFIGTHDPTTLNRQNHDIGTEYRSLILTTSKEQQTEALAFIKELEGQRLFNSPIVTEVKPLDVFYPAEEEHRAFYKKNPDQMYCQVVINPKMEKFRKRYRTLLKKG